MVFWRQVVLLGGVLAACDPPTGADYEQCELDLALEPASAAPGANITAVGRPFTADFDTVVRVGGVDAEITLVDRDDCAACDTCRFEAGCNQCETCVRCDEACATCVEQLQFVVPALAPGAAPVTVANGYGASLPIPFVVTEGTR